VANKGPPGAYRGPMQQIEPHAGPKAKCLKWRPFRRGPLRGFSQTQFTSGLILSEIGVLKAGERIWIQPPARAWVERDTTGQPKWQQLVHFENHGVRADFGRQVVRALLIAFPNALDGEEPESGSSDALEAEEAQKWFERQQGRGGRT
jgi:hypothetical protein